MLDFCWDQLLRMVSNNQFYIHKLLGHLLLPLRLLATLPFLFLAIIFIFLYNFGILPKKIAYFFAKLWAIASNAIFGIKIHIKKDKEYEKYKTTMEARIDKLVKENLKITKKYDETFDVLMKQQN